MNLLFEDTGDFDLTTMGLEIGSKSGIMYFSPKQNIILSGAKEVEKILVEQNVRHTFYFNDGNFVAKNNIILEVLSNAENLHKLWKISQNIFEYLSGIATYTNTMTMKAKQINPNIIIATTRKNFPGVKKLMMQGVINGGGAIHRLGLFDSILIFKQHLVFLDDEDIGLRLKNLKSRFIEKKIVVEVDNFDDGLRFCEFGADILQCEKMSLEELSRCVELKKRFPAILISATGGINLENVEAFASTGVDFLVTSAPYHANPIDIKVEMKYK